MYFDFHDGEVPLVVGNFPLVFSQPALEDVELLVPFLESAVHPVQILRGSHSTLQVSNPLLAVLEVLRESVVLAPDPGKILLVLGFDLLFPLVGLCFEVLKFLVHPEGDDFGHAALVVNPVGGAGHILLLDDLKLVLALLEALEFSFDLFIAFLEVLVLDLDDLQFQLVITLIHQKNSLLPQHVRRWVRRRCCQVRNRVLGAQRDVFVRLPLARPRSSVFV